MISAIILAAGRGKRMKSKTTKVLQELHARPLIFFIIETLNKAGIGKKALVVSANDKTIEKAFDGLDIIRQKKPLGSGDAVREAERFLAGSDNSILVVCGDTPFITKESIKDLIKKHREKKAACTLLTARLEDPREYGRILRDAGGDIVRIAEEKDLARSEKALDEVNVGCYCFNKKDLLNHIGSLKLNRKKKEYYLTDIVMILKKEGRRIASVTCRDSIEALGINSKCDLARANEIMKNKILKSFMLNGVTVVDPQTTFVDMEAKIGRDTVIYPNTVIEKGVIIGKNCRLGPFARIRKGTTLSDNVHIGNFVELVRTRIGSGTRVKHMTYLGDAKIGKKANIGAGTITANYDGKNKNRTVIGDRAFVGVGSILIAPVKVGRDAVIGAGSVVTKNKNVPPGKTVVGIPARVLNKTK